MKAVILQHLEIEGPGLLKNLLVERGIAMETVYPEKQEIPEADIYIAMGGPMSVNDNNEWLKKEIDTIKQHVESGGFYFGTCLGAQLLAKAIGGTVSEGKREVGGFEAEVTSEGSKETLLQGLGEKLKVFHWHGETFSILPEEAVVIATGNGMNQAFKYKNAYGLQFHLEPDANMVFSWIKADEDYVTGAGTNRDDVMKNFEENMNAYTDTLKIIFNRFLDGTNER